MEWTGDPITGAASALSSVVGAWQQNKMIKKQIRAQQEENEKTRNYNLMLARMQNAWNVEQWERENEYNTPAIQRQRLAAAKMNADLAYSGDVSNLAAASPSMTSGDGAVSASMSPMSNYQSVGSITTTALDNALKAANIRKINKETENIQEDTTGKH